MSKPKIEIYQDNVNEWRWRVTATNGRIIGASSEGYKNKEGAEDNLHALFKALDTPAVWIDLNGEG